MSPPGSLHGSCGREPAVSNCVPQVAEEELKGVGWCLRKLSA